MTEPNVTLYCNKTTGYYHARIYWPDTKEKPFRPSLGTRDPKEARVLFDEFKRARLPDIVRDHHRALAAPQREASADPSISSLATWYIDKFLPQAGLAPRSVQKYAQLVDDFVIYCRGHHVGRASQVAYSTIIEFTDWLNGRDPSKRAKGPKAQKSRNDVKATLRRWFNCCVDSKLLDAAPVEKWFIKKPKPGALSKRTALTPDECRAMLDALTKEAPSVASVAAFLLYTGCRISDALDLRWSQIHGATVHRTQVKGGIPHTFSLNDQALAIIEAARQMQSPAPRRSPSPSVPVRVGPRSSVFVFTNTTGDPWSYDAAYRAFIRGLHRAGFTITRDGQPYALDLHTLRHTYATHSANLGCPAPVLMQQLGHSRIETTLQYYHPDAAASLAWSQRYADHIATPQTTEQPRHSKSHSRKNANKTA